MCNLLTKDDVSSRLRVVLSFKERWTDWHQTAAHTTTSSQSQYPTVTRTETSTSNRSVIWSPRSLGALVNYWHHYVAMCNGELWISAQIKTFILQTVPFKLQPGQNTNHACSWWNVVVPVQDQHKTLSKQAVRLKPSAYFHMKSDLLTQMKSWTLCVKWFLPKLLDNNHFIALMDAINFWMQLLFVILPLQDWATMQIRVRIREHKNTDKTAPSWVIKAGDAESVINGKLCSCTPPSGVWVMLCNLVKVSLPAQIHRHLFTV